MQLYLHDFSEFARGDPAWGEVDQDGLFSYIYLESYWTEEQRKPLIFRVNGKLAGFALINDWSATGRTVDWCVSEFFVMRRYRLCGLGRQAAHQIIHTYPGVWEIAVVSYNLPAVAFWKKVAVSVESHEIEELAGDGIRWSGPIFRLSPKQCSPNPNSLNGNPH
jgi:predicted acetyltransferase